MYQYFSVRVVRPEAVSSREQAGAELDMVVDLAVEHYPDALVFVAHGLLASSQVDDREPARAERDFRAGPGARIVGPAMLKRTRHAQQAIRVWSAGEPANAAHRTAVPR